MNKDELSALLDQCLVSENAYLHAIGVIALSSGARREEIRTIKWADVFLDEGKIVVRKTKNKKNRTIHLAHHALAEIPNRHDAKGKHDIYVFPSDIDANKPIDFRRAWRTALKRSKLKDFRFHDLRHTTSTFSALAESLNKARQNKAVLSASDIAYLKGVEKRLSAFQQKILPGLRLGFKKRASEVLWLHDMEVGISSAGNKIIGFYAGEFSLNGNIQAAQEQLHEILTKLRFKEARYAWRETAAGYAYKLDTPPDGKLSYFLHGKFQDMAAGY